MLGENYRKTYTSFEVFQTDMWGLVVDYPYLFQTCGFARVDDIRAEIESQADWDFVPSQELSNDIQVKAANRFGFYVPFSPEQRALTSYLIKRRAGEMISVYAWGLFAQSRAPQRQYA